VSASSVMSDVPMLCLWVWSMVLWFSAIDAGRAWEFIIAGLITAASALCKYPALQLVPLLALTTLQRRTWPAQILALALPILSVAAFQWISRSIYGGGYVSIAASYAADQWLAHLRSIAPQLLVGLCFLGGCGLPAAAIILVSAPARWLIGAVLGMVAVIAAVMLWPRLMQLDPVAAARPAAV